MSSPIKILVTGITGQSNTLVIGQQALFSLLIHCSGYIGGAVVGRLLRRPDAARLDIRAIVRSPEKAEKLKSFGISPIIGSHNDENVMVKASEEVDVIIAMVSFILTSLFAGLPC